MLTEHISGDFSVFQEERDVQISRHFLVGNSPFDVSGVERLEAFREWLDVLAV